MADEHISDANAIGTSSPRNDEQDEKRDSFTKKRGVLPPLGNFAHADDISPKSLGSGKREASRASSDESMGERQARERAYRSESTRSLATIVAQQKAHRNSQKSIEMMASRQSFRAQQRSISNKPVRRKPMQTQHVPDDDLSIVEDPLIAWGNDHSQLDGSSAVDLATNIIRKYYYPFGSVHMSDIVAFLWATNKKYDESAKYNNFVCAVDALVSLTSLLFVHGADQYVPSFERWCLAISCLCYGVGNNSYGAGNMFHILAETDLASIYNDSCPIQSHAASIAWGLVKDHSLLAGLDHDIPKRARSLIISNIISTDHTLHATLMERLEAFTSLSQSKPLAKAAIINPHDMKTLCNVLSHASQILRFSKAFDAADQWVERLSAALFEQGEALRELRIDVPPHMDPRLSNSLTTALTMTTNFTIPTALALNLWLPRTATITTCAKQNLRKWANAYEESQPAMAAKRASTTGTTRAKSINSLLDTRDEVSNSVFDSSLAMLNNRDSLKVFHKAILGEKSALACAALDPFIGEDELHAMAEMPDYIESESDLRTDTIETVPPVLTPKQMIGKVVIRCLEGNLFAVTSFLFTVCALVLDFIRIAYLHKDADQTVFMVLFVTLLFFAVEVFLLSVFKEKFLWSFFFWLDIAGTISLVFDIPWLLGALIGNDGSTNVLVFARAGRAARAGSKAARLVQLVRFARLVRLVKVLKFTGFFGDARRPNDNNEDLSSNPTLVGQVLAELLSRRVVILVLLVVLTTSMLESTQSDSGAHQGVLETLSLMTAMEGKAFLDDSDYAEEFRVLFCSVNGQELHAKASHIDEFRQPEEVARYELTFNKTFTNELWISTKERSQQYGVVNLAFIICMVGLLSIGSWMFTGIANDLVIAPMARLLKVVAALGIALNSLDDDSRRAVLAQGQAEVQVSDAKFETSFLEDAIVRMTELLHAGYGTAGAEIIQKNLGLSGGGNTLDTFIRGAKVKAIFGFCDVRRFTDTTEVLQEDVLVFVNLLGHIVHQNVQYFGGSPNKNIGDAFLLVWKNISPHPIPRTSKKLFPSFLSYKDRLHAKTLADGALKAMVQCVYDLEHLNRLKESALIKQLAALGFHDASASQNHDHGHTENIDPTTTDQPSSHHGSYIKRLFSNSKRSAVVPEIDEPMSPATNQVHMQKHLHIINHSISAARDISGGVKMGIGLHYGWAIEGAVGTLCKIDATYLSPHVNMAARLEAATKQYGVSILLSNAFVDLLSPEVSILCREIDRVTVKGSKIPLSLFTFDFYYGEWMDELGLCVFKDLPKSTSTVEYLQLFNKGLRAYEDGEWSTATRLMMQCQKILPTDRPARVILSVMSKYNFQCPDNWNGFRALTEK